MTRDTAAPPRRRRNIHVDDIHVDGGIDSNNSPLPIPDY